MATRGLSPHQITQKLLKHRLAVATLARQVALKAVKHRLRTDGLKQASRLFRERHRCAGRQVSCGTPSPACCEAGRKSRRGEGSRLGAYLQRSVRKVPRNRTLAKGKQRQFMSYRQWLTLRRLQQIEYCRAASPLLPIGNVQSTARYTALAPDRFAGFWQD
jgi:hypothetical protein